MKSKPIELSIIFVYCILMKMQGNFLLDLVIPEETEARFLQTCFEPVYKTAYG